jgi:arylsulfatase A-like enzyme
VLQAASDWLGENSRNQPFFLHVDCFDIHEPFHIPEPYRSLYSDADYRRFNPWPLYGRTDTGWAALEQEEIDWVRAQFAGKLTMVDRWLGRVFESLEQSGLWDETIVVITTDHGHFLGEHNWIGKPGAPLYDELRHLPLLVWHPDAPGGGRRVPAITQTVDLYATILDLFGSEPGGVATHSRSFAPALADVQREHRAFAVSGYNNERVAICDGEWTLLRTHDPGAAPAYVYTQQIEQVNNFGVFMREFWRRENFEDIEAGHFIPGAEMPVWRMPRDNGEDWDEDQPPGDLLFHADDVQQLVDRAASEPAVVVRLEAILAEHAAAIGAPQEQLTRLRLSTRGSEVDRIGS